LSEEAVVVVAAGVDAELPLEVDAELDPLLLEESEDDLGLALE